MWNACSTSPNQIGWVRNCVFIARVPEINPFGKQIPSHMHEWTKTCQTLAEKPIIPINNRNRCTSRQSLCRTLMWNMSVEPPNIPQLKDWHMQTNTCLHTRTNLPKKSEQSFQNRKWMAQTNKNLIHASQNKSLQEVKFIIAKGLLKITNQCLANQPTKSATTNTQRSRHQHAIGIAACGMGSAGLTHA